jgi:hypothetical protein
MRFGMKLVLLRHLRCMLRHTSRRLRRKAVAAGFEQQTDTLLTLADVAPVAWILLG